MSVLDELLSESKRAAHPHFVHCCYKAGVHPTNREFRKYSDKRGLAYAEHKKIADGNRGKGVKK